MRSPELPANRASAWWASPAFDWSATSTETSFSSPVVRVPVLSTQIVSTAARASVALICWTRVSRRARRTAATARVTLISSTRPSGIRVINPAVAVCAASRAGSLRALRAKIRTTASGSISQVVARRTLFTSSWRGEGG